MGKWSAHRLLDLSGGFGAGLYGGKPGFRLFADRKYHATERAELDRCGFRTRLDLQSDHGGSGLLGIHECDCHDDVSDVLDSDEPRF
jgi:hypothetical protein